MLIKALHNQSVFDVLQQHCGSIKDAMAFAVANGISITDDLIPGTYYLINSSMAVDTDILNYYTNNGYTPATAITAEALNADYGIGEMSIGNTFIVR